MKLYGSPIPKASSFAYLGVPFSPQGKIATDLLIRRNTASAISAMRATLLPIGPSLSTVCESASFNLSNSSSLKKHKINFFEWLSMVIIPLQPAPSSIGQPDLGVDSYLTLRMCVHDRSRLLRWRMGWLSGSPIACCGHPHVSRAHLLSCFRVAIRLNVALSNHSNSLD
ncbi:hypothetical protein G6F69_007064 [Rhizopus microsporus]|nr:hypothetical protein G6F69_007064 [Rhizopus microsporus]KAG1227469.1 hypothetical protein G6F67_008433 [Rhizopus microsporus]